jgi:CheY-like chemotaxis protein
MTAPDRSNGIKPLRVFISSTYEDLVEYRDRVAEAVERLGQERVRMEVFGARPKNALSASLDDIRRSDAIVGIYAHRYGYVPEGSDKSITEAEYDQAVTLNIPTFCFIVNDDYPWPPKHVDLEPGRTRLRAFKERIGNSIVRDTFTTPDDLAFKIVAALGRFLVQQAVRKGLDAAARSQNVGPESALNQVARRAERMSPLLPGARVLIVNDVPAEMQHVVRILRDLRLEVTVATTTETGIALLGSNSFDVVVSDMRRGGEFDAGIQLIREMRGRGLDCPTILTPGRFEPERGTPPYAFGITNRVDELLNLLFDVLERARG